MAGKFECYKDKAGEFRFRLKAGNGETTGLISQLQALGTGSMEFSILPAHPVRALFRRVAPQRVL